MEFYLSFNNNEQNLRLPVLPPSFGVVAPNNNQTVNINEIGDIKLIGKTGLKSMTIETFFPNQNYSFVEYSDFPQPYECVELIENWRTSGKPIRIIITDTPVNFAMAIESFVFDEQDGSGDVYYTLELEEYPFTNVKQSKSEYEKPAQVGNKNNKIKRETKDISKEYVVKPGDTLSMIAKKATGNSANYKKIAEKNGIKNPNIISVGQVIKL